MRLAALALAAAALIAGAGGAWAETYTPLPRYDVDKGYSIWSTPEEPTGAQSCIQLEQDNYNEVKAFWPSAPEYVRQFCIASNEKQLAQSQIDSNNPKSKSQRSFFYMYLSACLNPKVRDAIPRPLPDHFKP